MSVVIEMKNVRWVRDGAAILDGVNWTVAKGEHWALLGLNGSGKTTLLNMVAGYIWPTEGEVSVLGHRYGAVDLRQLRRRIGWVSSSFQARIHPKEPALHVVLSGRHASIGLFEAPTDEDIRRALDAMDALDCRHTARRPYETCSHGEKQRVLIARALMSDPDLLILDEPCTGLDFVARESLLERVAELSRRPDGPTVVYVTHHVEEILPEFTHTLLLRQGTATAQGPSNDVLQAEPLSEAFGAPVRVIEEGGRRWVVPETEDATVS